MKKKASKIFFHPIVIALLTGAVSFFIFSLWINKYKGEVIENRTFDKKYDIYYENLFHDSTNEKIISTNYSPLNHGLIKIKNVSNNKFLGIWNLNEQNITRAPILFGDYDNNKTKEIWAFTRKKDSLFYYIIDPREDGKFIRERCFITKTRLIKGNKVDIAIRRVGEQDINGDGYKEMYFAIDAGFSFTPRRIFAVDLLNSKIYKSPKTGVRFNKEICLHDITGNPGKEIILKTHASDNYPDSSNFPYNDNSSWLMVLDKNLKFLFEPVEFSGAPSRLDIQLFLQDEKKFIATLFINNERYNQKTLLGLYNTSGEKIKEVDLNALDMEETHLLVKTYNRKSWKKIVWADINGNIYLFDEQLKITDKKTFSAKTTGFLHYKDIDTSIPGQEVVIPSSSGFFIADNHFNLLTKVPTSSDCLAFYNISIVKKSEKGTILSFSSAYKYYQISYTKNPLFTYRWGLALAVSLFIFFVIQVNQYHLKKRKNKLIHKKLRLQEAEKKRLAKDLHDELGSKLTGLRLQIENIKENENRESLNEITNYINETHKEIRNIIHNLTPPRFRDQGFVELTKELVNDYNNYSDVSIYLDIFPNRSWNGELSDLLKFHAYRILQEILTNIIKHSGATNAHIQMIKENKFLLLYIEDNGKGFNPEDYEQTDKGLGLENIKLRTDLLNGKIEIKPDNKGTIIEIELPLN